jgi:hypothetical protein
MGIIAKPRGGSDKLYSMLEGLRDVQERHVVKVVDLDTLLDKLSLQRVDLVKIDVEGFEEHVLKGLMRRITKRLINFIVIEVHQPLLLSKCSRLIEENYDLRVFKISRGLYLVYAINKSLISESQAQPHGGS